MSEAELHSKAGMIDIVMIASVGEGVTFSQEPQEPQRDLLEERLDAERLAKLARRELELQRFRLETERAQRSGQEAEARELAERAASLQDELRARERAREGQERAREGTARARVDRQRARRSYDDRYEEASRREMLRTRDREERRVRDRQVRFEVSRQLHRLSQLLAELGDAGEARVELQQLEEKLEELLEKKSAAEAESDSPGPQDL